MSIGALIVIVVAIEGVLHYFPWRLIFKKELPRLIAYTLGVLGFLLPFSVWLWEQGQARTLSILWVVTVSAGMSVCFWYAVDWLLDRLNVAAESQEREHEAMSRLKESRHDVES